jgi:hypothetical protein
MKTAKVKSASKVDETKLPEDTFIESEKFKKRIELQNEVLKKLLVACPVKPNESKPKVKK